MESIQHSILAMKELFDSRMGEFQNELTKTQSGASSSALESSTLGKDFLHFKVVISAAVNSLLKQVEFLTKEVDRLDMYNRRKHLLLHGVAEQNSEDITQVVVKVIRDQLKFLDFSASDIAKAHRMGKPSLSSKPRPIVIKFMNISTKARVWRDKTHLKGTGVTVSEFLTKFRHDLFLAARQRFGVTRCWTRDGNIMVLGPDDVKHRVSLFSELENICSATAGVSPAKTEEPAKPATRSRRPHRK